MTALGKADPYSKALARHSSYQLEAVLPCAAALVELMVKAPTNTLTAVYKKYSSTKFAEVTTSSLHSCDHGNQRVYPHHTSNLILFSSSLLCKLMP